MLKKSTYILLSILLCIPLVFIIYFSLSIRENKPSSYSLKELTVKSSDGHEFSYGAEEDLGIYLSAVQNAKKIDAPVRDISNDVPAVVTHIEEASKYSYDYYLSLDTSECYFVDTNGEYFRIGEEDAKKLVVRDEFIDLYDNYSLPTLSMSAADGAYALPVATDEQGQLKANWSFKRGQDEAATAGAIGTVEDPGVISFGIGNELSVDFSVIPDSCTVKVFNGGTAVHSAEWKSYDDTMQLSDKLFGGLADKLSYASDTRLTCEITAIWQAIESSVYSGSATYRASLLFDKPIECTTVDGTLSPGHFTFIKIKNHNDGQPITLSSESAELILPEVRVHKIGDMTFAYLPIDFSTTNVPNSQKSHKIKVTSGKDEAEFTIAVKANTFTSTTVSTAAGTVGLDNSKAELEQLVKEYTAASVEEHLWSDSKDTSYSGSPKYSQKYVFAKPVVSTEEQKIGTKVTEDINLMNTAPYVRTYVTYKAADGAEVRATATGKVVHVGESAYSGNFVIIDHGFGLLSIYECLGSVSVQTGAYVKMNTVIGKVGSTGYSSGTGVRFSMSMEGIYIDPTSNFGGVYY